MFEIVSVITNSVLASSSDRSVAEMILAQVDTKPSSYEIVEVADATA